MQDNFLQFLALTKRAGKLIEGYNKCEEILKNKRAYVCIISDDISANSYEKFERLCANAGVPIIRNYGKETLANIIGRKEINILCIIDRNMGNRLIEIFNANQNNRG